LTGLGWQDALGALLAVAAVVYLVRRRRVRPKPPLVSLGRAKSAKKR